MINAEFLASLPDALSLEGAKAARFAEVAPAIRRDLKLAAKAGLIPAGAKWSVRALHYGSLMVEIVAWPGQVMNSDYQDKLMAAFAAGASGLSAADYDGIISERARRAGRRLSFDGRLHDSVSDALVLAEQIADRHNYDRSQIEVDHFDVGYYLTVSARGLIALAEQGMREELDPGTAALRTAARAAAARLGDKVVRSICGRAGVEGCGDYSLRKLITLDEQAAGRPVEYNKQRGRWLPVSAAAIEGRS